MAKAPSGKGGNNREVFIDFENFALGLWSLQDTTKAPFGSARIMSNMQITDRGGIAPRPGTKLLGTKNTTASATRGLFNFRKSFDQDEFLMKAYDDELEIYSKNHSGADWFRLKDGFTPDKEFGFASSLVNTDLEDKVLLCNRYEPFQEWKGAVTQVDGALSGGETSVVVDSVLTDEIFASHSASENAGHSDSTLQIDTSPWGADQWNTGMYVYIKSGTYAGYISPITDTTADTITFTALAGDVGACDFEIRQAAFPASGTIIVGGTTVAYSAIPRYDRFTVSSAPAAADNAGVALVPTEYPLAPRGNRITNLLTRIVVGNVRSAQARGTGGALQGYASGGSYFVSKLKTPTDFGFSAARVAGEGDMVGTPYGGGEITDVNVQEQSAYIFKPHYIEAVQYSQDANDLATREPLKAQVGASVPTIRGTDDIYFITADNAFTSIGRTLNKDVTVQTANIGYRIKRLLDSYTFDFGRGFEHKNKILIPAKSMSSLTANDKVIVYNKLTNAFWGIWDIPANFFERFDGELYYGDSVLPNVYQMFVGNADVDGTDRYPISAEYATQFMNLTPSDGSLQALNGLYYEGYITGDSVITFKAWKEFESDPFLQFDFSGTESAFLSGTGLNAFLGGTSMGLKPHGALSEPDEDNRRHFYFRVYFPFQYGYHFSLGLESSGTDIDYEITRFGMSMKSTVTQNATKIKGITS